MLLSSKGAVLCLTKALLSAKQKSFSLSNQRAVVCLTKALFRVRPRSCPLSTKALFYK